MLPHFRLFVYTQAVPFLIVSFDIVRYIYVCVYPMRIGLQVKANLVNVLLCE